MADVKQNRQDAADTKLILYRLDRVEGAVTELGTKLDKQDNIKRADLIEFRETIITRVTDMQSNFQRQIDAKADATSVTDLKKLIGAISAFFLSIAGSLFVYLLTKGR